MTQEDKELLLKDLCARSPYCPKIKTNIWGNSIFRLLGVQFESKKTPYFHILEDTKCLPITDDVPLTQIKPYLRTMSSMTREERQYLLKYASVGMDENDKVFDVYPFGMENNMAVVDFLNAHHFDYRGLIKKGLALEAPERMYTN